MKAKVLLLVTTLLSSALLFSCQEKKRPIAEMRLDKRYTICYRAVADKDTGWLSIDTGLVEIKGILSFNYPEKKEKFEGQFKGKMFGDTLKGHFDFRVNKADIWYRNPVAFLKKDGRFTMGVGRFMLIMGSAHFDNLVPIDFEKGRFIFELGECRDQPMVLELKPNKVAK